MWNTRNSIFELSCVDVEKCQYVSRQLNLISSKLWRLDVEWQRVDGNFPFSYSLKAGLSCNEISPGQKVDRHMRNKTPLSVTIALTSWQKSNQNKQKKRPIQCSPSQLELQRKLFRCKAQLFTEIILRLNQLNARSD